MKESDATDLKKSISKLINLDGPPKFTELYDLAFTYESHLAEVKRKSGVHYTHPKVAYMVARHTLDPIMYNVPKTPKIADIACGSGVFLVATVHYLTTKYRYCPIHLVENCVYGADLDAGATDVTKLCLWLICNKSPQSLRQIQKHVVYGDSLVGATEPPTRGLFGIITPNYPSDVPIHWYDMFPEVLQTENPGFDAIVGNPPFLGGTKILEFLGKDYRDWMTAKYMNGRSGIDLVVYFFLRAFMLLKKDGVLGLISTNSVAEGQNRVLGLERLVNNGLTIYRAVRSTRWIGDASLNVSYVWTKKGKWDGKYILGKKEVSGINSHLYEAGNVPGSCYRLETYKKLLISGSNVKGYVTILSSSDVKELVSQDKSNRKLVCPFLNGKRLTTYYGKSKDWIINFKDWPLNRSAVGKWKTGTTKDHREWLATGSVPSDYQDPVAVDYPEVLEKLKGGVRNKSISTDQSRHWWQYARPTSTYYQDVAGLNHVLVRSRVSKHNIIMPFHPTQYVFSASNIIFINDDWGYFATMASDIHWVWVLKYGSTLGATPIYTFDCFCTFPLVTSNNLRSIGEEYNIHRWSIAKNNNEGLTKVYNRFHSREDDTHEVKKLRYLHVKQDNFVLDAYGWSDIKLRHGFYDDSCYGTRFIINPDVVQEILDRLLKLNHEQYVAEVRKGLHM